MAKSQKRAVKRAEFKGYHNVNLSKADVVLFESWKVGQSPQISDFDTLANAGYKFSITWDEYHQGVSAALYAKDAKMEWAGYTLTAWADCSENAILLLFFKHYILCTEKWEVAPERSSNEGLSYG